MTRKFLLVDDDMDDAILFCEALKQLTWVECITAESGFGLSDLLEKHSISNSDLIFLDINMPMIDGWECLKQLKNNPRYHRIPVIMYSTSSATHDINLAYDLGAQLFLTKPEDFRELKDILAVLANATADTFVRQLQEFKSIKIR